MRLKEYLFRTETTQTDFAKKVGCSREHLTGIINGLRWPSKKLAAKIEEATEGKVTVKEMLRKSKVTKKIK